MKALILDGLIVDVAPAEFPVAPSMAWVDCPADASPGTHVFDGAAVVVKPPKTAAEIAADEKAAALRELDLLDLKSIRAMREYIAAQPDAPQILKDREAAAAAARAKLGGAA